MIQNAMVIDPARNGHEYELLTRSRQLKIHDLIYAADAIYQFKNENIIGVKTCHQTLKRLARTACGYYVFEIDLQGKDPEWWEAKLHACNWIVCQDQTDQIRSGTGWKDVWVCMPSSLQ